MCRKSLEAIRLHHDLPIAMVNHLEVRQTVTDEVESLISYLKAPVDIKVWPIPPTLCAHIPERHSMHPISKSTKHFLLHAYLPFPSFFFFKYPATCST